jgi:hypothetical protein
MSRAEQRSRSSYLLPPFGYLLVALSGPVSYLIAMSRSADGDIGAGLAILWTGVWGLPWSIWPWTSGNTLGSGLALSFLACALVNVGLLSSLMWWRWRRATAKSTADRSSQAPSAAANRED